MRIGLSTYTYAWAIGGRKYAQDENLLPVPRLLDKAASVPGAELLQICDRSGAELLDAAERRGLRARAAELGVALQIGTTGVDPAHLNNFLAVALDLGADLVRTILPASGPGSSYDEAAALLREILPAYEKSGVLLSLENHDRNLSRDLRDLVEGLACPVLGICLDTVNSFGIGEDSRRVLDALVPVTNCFHAKDYRIGRIDTGLGFLLEGTPTGQGMLDIPDIILRFDRAGLDPDIVVELWTPYRGDLAAAIALEDAWARESVQYLRKTIDTFGKGRSR